MLLGVVLHAGMFLLPAPWWPAVDEWAYRSGPEHNPYVYLLAAIHGFRMQVFFLLSGFFTAMLWRSRGMRHLIQHRLERIGLPLLVGMFTIIPVTLWLLHGIEFDSLLEWPLAWLNEGFAHLWFLWYLLWIVASFVLAVRLGLNFRHRLWWLLVPLVIVPQLFMSEVFGPDSSRGHVLPPPRLLAYYGAFFYFGIFFYVRGFEVRRWWAAAIPPALALVFPAALTMTNPGVFLGFEPAWAHPAAAALQILYTWLMCFGLMGLFRWIASKERFWVRYISDASYWIYLAHLPLVVIGQMLVVSWPVSVHMKFSLICVVVVAILLVIYEAGIRYTRIGAVLHGPRRRQFLTRLREDRPASPRNHRD